MTYLSFLILFVISPILILLLLLRHNAQMPKWTELGVMALVAVVWTTPWDNYLVATGVWWYDDERILGIVLGYVPLEEYAFFVLQTVMTGLFLGYLMHPKRLMPNTAFVPQAMIWRVGLLVAILLSVLLPLSTGNPKWNYFILQVGWLALPPLAIQYLWGLDILMHYRRLWFWAVALPTLWLASMDAVAIYNGVWTIDPDQTILPVIGGVLPMEEALFFLITNLLVVQGLILIIVPESWQRLYALRRHWSVLS